MESRLTKETPSDLIVPCIMNGLANHVCGSAASGSRTGNL